MIKKHLGSLKQQLFAYQLQSVGRFCSQIRLLIGDDMGLGKTAQATASCHVLWHTGKIRRGLLIVPASLKSQWQREWAAFTNVPISVVDGVSSERAAMYKKIRSGFLIANYEQLLRDSSNVGHPTLGNSLPHPVITVSDEEILSH